MADVEEVDMLEQEELEVVEDCTLVKKPNTTSKAWAHFGLKGDENGFPEPAEVEKPICRHCHKAVCAKRSNTSNLFSHLQDNHPEIYAELSSTCTKQSKKHTDQPTLVQVIERGKKYERTSKRAKELDDAVAHFIAKDMQPFYTVEKEGFKKMLKIFDPKYSLPSRNYFAEQKIPKLYTELRDNVVKPVLHEASFYAVTTDLWTSCARHPFMSLTVHFINDHWQLKSFCLETVPFLEDHTGQNLADTVQDTLVNWELDPANLICATTDNGSNFVSAFTILDWTRISCFGHNLDLCVNKAIQLDRVQRALSRCHSLIALFNRSWKKNRDLRVKQVQLGLDQHKLISDVATRWGFTFHMIDRILEQHKAISAVLADDRKNWHHMPTDQELRVLETVAAVLRPLSVFTDALSGEKHLTISAVRPLLRYILDEILVVLPEDCAISKEMKEIISDKLQTYYIHEDISNLLDKCTYLDPRFKLRYLSDEERTQSRISNEAKDVCASLNLHNSHESEATTKDVPPQKKRKGLGAILNRIVEKRGDEHDARSPQEVVQKEITRYLELPDLDTDSDPLNWWNIEAKHLPILAQLARKYLCTCATSVPSERVFSKAGYIANHFRARLSAENINKLVFLSKNL